MKACRISGPLTVIGDELPNCLFKIIVATVIFLNAMAFPVSADESHPVGVRLDGTVGNAGVVDLLGPNYEIRAEYGRQTGANLFHSFEQFNLHAGESATFLGAEPVKNVIGRITGGTSSWIDGMIQCAIPDADLYFLNRAGVMFGPNASVDLLGSFHVGAADYLRLGNHGRFHSVPNENDLLSVEPPAAFGFLETDPGPISVRGAEMSVLEGRTILMAGGEINVSAGEINAPGGQIVLSGHQSRGELEFEPQFTSSTPESGDTGGKITLSDKSTVDVSGEGGGSVFIIGGELFVHDSQLFSKTKGSVNGGQINISGKEINFANGSVINTSAEGPGEGADIELRATDSVAFSGENADAERCQIISYSGGDGLSGDNFGNGGNIHIRAENISLDNVYLSSFAFGKGDSGEIEIFAGGTAGFSGYSATGRGSRIVQASSGSGNAGDVVINAKNILLADGAVIDTNTQGNGNSGNITLNAEQKILVSGENPKGTGYITAGTIFSTGEGGDVRLEANDIVIEDGNGIYAQTSGLGNAGSITITARDSGSLTIAGTSDTGYASTISCGSISVFDGIPAGQGGAITINAGDLDVRDGGNINSGTSAGTGLQSGDAGDITITVSGRTTLSGVNRYGETEDGFASGVYANANGTGNNTGGAGDIYLETGGLVIENGAVIETSTNCNADGGNIKVVVSGTAAISGDASDIELYEPAGAQEQYLARYSPLNYNQSTSGVYVKTESVDKSAGTGGDIDLSAEILSLSDGAAISSSSSGGGNAGNIFLNVGTFAIAGDSSVTSDSLFENSYHFDDLDHRNQNVLGYGDVINVGDTGNGKSASYLHTGSIQVKIPVYSVQNLSELNALDEQNVLSNGDVALVTDGGDGEPARFVYNRQLHFPEREWTRISEDSPVATFADMTELWDNTRKDYENEDHAPYASGSLIEVTDAGNGRPATFVYVLRDYSKGNIEAVFSEALVLSHYPVADISELNELATAQAIPAGAVADIDGANYLFTGDDWAPFKNEHQVVDIPAQNRLINVQAGNVAHVDDAGGGNPGSFVYSGKEWIPVNEVVPVDDMAARDALSPQPGDVVKVAESTDGKPQTFLSSDGGWVDFVRGDAGSVTILADTVQIKNGGRITTSSHGHGNAGNIQLTVTQMDINSGASVSSTSNSPSFGGESGTITIEADRSVTLMDNGSVTAEAVDAGGGNISIAAKEELRLGESEITTSVREGTGKGGDISISSGIFVLNESRIIANAIEGDGGAIHIHPEHYLKSGDSVVEASSQRGNDGTVKTETPDLDVTGGLTVLPANFIDAARWMKTPCAARSGENTSRLVMADRAGIPTYPDGWRFTVASDRTAVIDNRLAPVGNAFRNGNFSEMARILENNNTGPLDAVLLSHAYSMLGHYRKALAVLVETSPDVKNSNIGALVLSSLGDLYLRFGNRMRAIDSLKAALDKAKQTENPLVMAGVLNNLGNLRATVRNYRDAKKAYRESLELIGRYTGSENEYEIIDLASLKSKVMINMARVEIEKGRRQDAIAMVGNAREQIVKQRDGYNKAEDLMALSLLARKVAEKSPGKMEGTPAADPETGLKQAAHIGKTIGNPRLVALACGYLADCFEAAGRFSEALNVTRQAIHAANRGYYPEILYRQQWRMGRLFKREGRIEDAIHYYSGAIATLNPIRMEFPIGRRNRKNTFEEDVKPVYLGLAQLFLEAAETASESPKTLALLTNARDTMETLKKAELQDFFQDECLAAADRKTGPGVGIPSRTAILYPIPLRNHLVLLLMANDGMKQIKVPVDSEQLNETAKIFREKMEEYEDDFLDTAQQLYGWLIHPIEEEFAAQNTDTLIVSPEGALRLIPFSALHDGERFLIEKYALGTIPAIGLTDMGPAELETKLALLSGLSEAKHGLTPLKHIKKELREIQTMTGGKVLLDQEFTTENLKSEIKNQDYDIVHLSTHAIFGGGPEDTYLYTYNDKLTMDGLEQIIGLKRFQKNQIDLLTLSACETALGDERAAFGLAGVALKAGAKSAVATLWPVDDRVTSMLVNKFYRKLASGVSKAKTLQNAQKSIIMQTDYQHPAYWAPFLLIGNWL